MGIHKGSEDAHSIRVSHRGWTGFQNKYGTCLILRDGDGRIMYSAKTEKLKSEGWIKAEIDSIKDYERSW